MNNSVSTVKATGESRTFQNVLHIEPQFIASHHSHSTSIKTRDSNHIKINLPVLLGLGGLALAWL